MPLLSPVIPAISRNLGQGDISIRNIDVVRLEQGLQNPWVCRIKKKQILCVHKNCGLVDTHKSKNVMILTFIICIKMGVVGGGRERKGLCRIPPRAPKMPALPPHVPSELFITVKQRSAQCNIKTIK